MLHLFKVNSLGTLRLLLSLVIISSPFTSWFAINTLIRLPIIFLILLFTIFSFYTKHHLSTIQRFRFFREDPSLLLWLFSFIISATIHSTHFHSKLLTNTIAAFLIVFGFVFFLRGVLITTKLNIKDLTKYFFITLIILYFIILTDFILSNFFDTFLMEYFSTANIHNAIGFRRALWFSSSSPAQEPGDVAYFINVFWPFGMYYLKLIGKEKAILIFVFIQLLMMILLYSTAGISFFLIGILIASITTNDYNILRNLCKYSIIIFVLVFFSNPDFFVKNVGLLDYYSEVSEKLTLNSNNVSAGDRLNGWNNAICDFMKNPIFGKGPGYSKVTYSGGSYYGIVSYSMASIGIFGLITICFTFVSITYRFTQVDKKVRYFVIFTLFTAISKNFIGDAFFDLPLWIALVSVQYLSIYPMSFEK